MDTLIDDYLRSRAPHARQETRRYLAGQLRPYVVWHEERRPGQPPDLASVTAWKQDQRPGQAAVMLAQSFVSWLERVAA